MRTANMTEHNPSKREFIKTAVYVAPAILTLKAIPSFASSGSGNGDDSGNEDKKPKKPKKLK
jgi:hypothetical protein